MFNVKSLLNTVSVSITLILGVAITPGIASANQFSAQRSLLVSLFKGETESLLATLFKGGWGNQVEIQLAQSNPPPPRKNPGSSSAGGRRDPSSCPQDAGVGAKSPLLTALSPLTKPGLTLAERPIFLVYIPKTSAKNAEFSLRNRMGHGVYRTMIALPTTPTLISITLPAQAPPLAVDQLYTWSFAIICNADDRLDDLFVTGMVQRIALDATRSRQIQQALPRQQAILYQKADVWYDAIALLYLLKHSQHNDADISTAWHEMLQEGGLDTMIDSHLENTNPR